MGLSARIGMAAGALALLGGCGSNYGKGLTDFYKVSNMSSGQIISNNEANNKPSDSKSADWGHESETVIDLTQLICENSKKNDCSEKKVGEDKQIDALQNFYRGLNETPTDAQKEDLRLRRNRIQDYILGVSDRRCAVYRDYINLTSDNVDFLGGAVSTASGVLGGLFTAKSTSRALSGIAGLSSGITAEYNASFFKDQTLAVIFSGINISLTDIHTQIATDQAKAITDYTLEHAIKDATRYNGACSLATGLDTVKDKIAKAGVPGQIGLEAASKIVTQAGTIRAKLTVAELTGIAKPSDDQKARLTAAKQYLTDNPEASSVDAAKAAKTGGTTWDGMLTKENSLNTLIAKKAALDPKATADIKVASANINAASQDLAAATAYCRGLAGSWLQNPTDADKLAVCNGFVGAACSKTDLPKTYDGWKTGLSAMTVNNLRQLTCLMEVQNSTHASTDATQKVCPCVN